MHLPGEPLDSFSWSWRIASMHEGRKRHQVSWDQLGTTAGVSGSASRNAHNVVLTLFQPTNHLDMEGMTGLIEALQVFKGGVISISHDERFITQTSNEVSRGISVGCLVRDSDLSDMVSLCVVVGLRRWEGGEVLRGCDAVQGEQQGIARVGVVPKVSLATELDDLGHHRDIE